MIASRVLLPLALALSSMGLVTSASAADPLQPGAYMETDVGGCTFNFVYDGVGRHKGRVYLGTAAHCAEKVGDQVRDAAGTVVGKIAFIGDPDGATTDDFAFVEINRENRSRVLAAVKGHSTYPRGVTTAAETQFGDLVQQSGYGLGFDLTALTREKRQSVLTGDDARRHQVLGAVIFGDSGGPLVHVPSGKALGIVSQLCIGLCEEEGPTVEGLIATAATAGFRVRLRTV